MEYNDNPCCLRRRTQVAKGEVCKTFTQRFESARRLQPVFLYAISSLAL
jgi:hypothetical protein